MYVRENKYMQILSPSFSLVIIIMLKAKIPRGQRTLHRILHVATKGARPKF